MSTEYFKMERVYLTEKKHTYLSDFLVISSSFSSFQHLLAVPGSCVETIVK